MAVVVRKALTQPSAFELMLLASQAIDETTPRPSDMITGRHRRPDALDVLCQNLLASGLPELGAMVLAIAAIHPDEDAAARLRSEVPRRVLHRGPDWLGWIDRMEVTDVAVNVHPLPDGDNAMITWRWPDRAVGTVSVYIDHNMGSIVKDAYAVIETVGAFIDVAHEHGDDPHIMFIAAKPADVRARVTEAMINHDCLAEPIVNDDWPACRPLVEWLVRQLPEGGKPYGRGHWTIDERRQLLDEFVASPHAVVPAERTGGEFDLIAERIVQFACEHGLGDPLRLSPVSVEILLVDWFPRTVFGFPNPLVDSVPEVLAGFIRYGHERAGIAGDLTDETVESIGQWLPIFRLAMDPRNADPESNARRSGDAAAIQALLQSPGRTAEQRGERKSESPEAVAALALEKVFADQETRMIAKAGGREAYERVDLVPLAVEPFDYRGPDDARAATDEALDLIDDWAPRQFDAEVQAIARMVLSHLSAADPQLIARSPRSTAAGLLRMVMQRIAPRASLAEGLGWAAATVAALAAATEVSAGTINKRAKLVEVALDDTDVPWPDYLHSSERRQILHIKRKVAEFQRRDPGR